MSLSFKEKKKMKLIKRKKSEKDEWKEKEIMWTELIIGKTRIG